MKNNKRGRENLLKLRKYVKEQPEKCLYKKYRQDGKADKTN